MAAKSKMSKLLTAEEPRGPDAPFDRAALAINEFELDQAQQIAGMIDAITRAFAGHLVVLPQHRRQLQLLEMMRQQNLGRAAGRARRHRVAGVAGHAASSGRSTA